MTEYIVKRDLHGHKNLQHKMKMWMETILKNIKKSIPGLIIIFKNKIFWVEWLHHSWTHEPLKKRQLKKKKKKCVKNYGKRIIFNT